MTKGDPVVWRWVRNRPDEGYTHPTIARLRGGWIDVESQGMPDADDLAIEALGISHIEYAYAAAGDEEVWDMKLCEYTTHCLHPGILYRFTVDPECDHCKSCALESQGLDPLPKYAKPQPHNQLDTRS